MSKPETGNWRTVLVEPDPKDAAKVAALLARKAPDLAPMILGGSDE